MALWEPFHKAMPNFTSIQLPKELKSIKQIPMGNLINRLRELRQVKIIKPFPRWIWGTIGAIILGLGVGIYLYCRCGRSILKCKKYWLANVRVSRRDDNAPPGHQTAEPRPTGEHTSPLLSSSVTMPTAPDPAEVIETPITATTASRTSTANRGYIYPTTFLLRAGETG